MMTFRSLLISIFPLILLLTQIDASPYRPLRQKRDNECPNLTVDACLFVNGCENGGQCIQDATTADCYQCICSASYTGKRCETSTGVIPTGCNPGCQNGGSCNVDVCICLAGYTGTFCETRNFCLPNNPCQNGGQCTSTGASYQCDCTGTGYTGPICTDVIITDPCTSNPCQNGGLCSWDGTTMNCVCANDYIGAFCQIAPVPCATAPCENGGTCELLSTNTYGCVCREEFTGTRCETSILLTHPCVTTPNLCLNGGTCTVNGANYLCKCTGGWGGTNCQIRDVTSSCNPNPCVHGSCYEINLPIGPMVYCNCENLWTGKYCSVEIDVLCPVGYCVNGVCQMIGNNPHCDCPPLYTGEQCDSLIDPITAPTPITVTTPIGGNACLSDPCQNGGTCFGNTDTFRCECLDPWSGPTCTETLITLTTTEPSTISPDITACSLSPCSNGGTCYPNANSFICVCTPEFTGASCETVLTTIIPPITTSVVPMDCTDQPCQNGGTCVPMGTSYSCFCGITSIYTGKNCDSTTPMTGDECPLDCTPGRCIFSGNPVKPYACLWNGIMRPEDGTTA